MSRSSTDSDCDRFDWTQLLNYSPTLLQLKRCVRFKKRELKFFPVPDNAAAGEWDHPRDLQGWGQQSYSTYQEAKITEDGHPMDFRARHPIVFLVFSAYIFLPLPVAALRVDRLIPPCLQAIPYSSIACRALYSTLLSRLCQSLYRRSQTLRPKLQRTNLHACLKDCQARI